MHIQDKEIQALVTNQKEYRYGRFFDIHNILERMTISLDEDNQCYRINARIQDDNKKYVLSLKMTTEGKITQHSCSCDLPKGCRHMASILFYLRTLQISSFPFFYEKSSEGARVPQLREIEQARQQRILERKQQDSMQLIELYKDQLVRESLMPMSSYQYQLKVFISKRKDALELALKVVNEGQCFVVKNMETFLHAIEHHESIKYSKNFEFIHSEDAFDDLSLEILTFVKRCYIKNQYLQRGIIRTLIVSQEHIDELYDLMITLPSCYSDIAFERKEYLLPLEINQKSTQYVLDLTDYREFADMMMTSRYVYIYDFDVLYRFNFKAPEKCLVFLKKLFETIDGLYIPQESLMDFYKYILVDIQDDILLETHLFDEYSQENIINLYGDMTNDDQICIQLEYIYDDKIRYAYDDHNPHKSKEADLIENYLKPYIEDIDEHMIYLLSDHEFAYQFMKEGLPYLSSYCQIYVSDALKNLSQNQSMHIQIGVSVSEGLLNINIENIDVQKDELYDLLKAYKRHKKFYKLKDGRIVSLENRELKELDDLTTSLQLNPQELSNGTIEIPTYRLFELNQKMDKDQDVQYLRSEEFKKWNEELVQAKQHYEVPTHYQGILRDYQIKGYQWLRYMQYYGFGGILADDMGLGKTLQMIVYFESLKAYGPHLVITPASLLLNWQSEIEKFSEALNVLCVNGQKSERDIMIKTIDHYDVVLTSYDYLRRDIEDYKDIHFHTIVLDEAQNIKNPKTRNAISVKRLKARQRFALTGTPIENSLAELWSIFDYLMPRYLYHYAYFLEHFERPIVREQDEEKQMKLKEMITPFVLRRNKKDVLKELPDKIEQTLYLGFQEQEEKLYLASLVQANKALQEKLDMNQLGRIDVLAMLTRLRQICQDPRLIYDNIEEPSSKLLGCMELIRSLKANGKKILLFSSFTSVLHLIEEQCHKEHISYYLLEGKTPKEKRKALVDSFQKDETTLFLISLKAGGSGLNLTQAQAVIHYDPWWNMSAKNQATDRAHRIGQTESVQVFSLIMKNTIEEKILDLQKKKKNLADAFVEGNEGTISTMSIEDMKALFEI